MINYAAFLDRKAQLGLRGGFEPLWMPDDAFDFQKHLIWWSTQRGRSGIFADCGLGKTLMQLAWAENVLRKTNRPVLILTPLAVGQQTIKEGEKFGIEAKQCRDGKFSKGLIVANYERLHYFDPQDFSAVVCDESSILKSFSGSTRKHITRFMNKLEYRLLCTATAAPNDYVELGTSSEALGELSHSDMLRRFFMQLDDKGQKREQALQDEAERTVAADPNYYKKLAYRIAQTIGQWRLKHHAVTPFWKWVASWARACRMPSDIGFSDDGFVLPPLIERDHIIDVPAPEGMLFNVPAFGMSEEREERKRSINERCEFAAQLVDHKEPAVVWCHTNAEADLLEKIIPDAKQIAGRTPDDEKVERYDAFRNGQLRVVVLKPKLGAWGLNWQHCRHIVMFPSHSYEQYYQAVRRCWRFGQTKEVRLDIVATTGEARVLGNLRRKAEKASKMFENIVREMNQAQGVKRKNIYTANVEVPKWVC